MISTALAMLTVLVPLQLVMGDLHGHNTREYQPAKLAAITGLWETTSGAPLTLFALPDQAAEKNKFAVEVPLLESLILTHSSNGTIRGLKEFPPDQRPPVAVVFFAFRIMVGAGMLMFGLVAIGWLLRFWGRLYETDLYLLGCQLAIPLGFIAVLAGWTTTEVGRQPWTVYGLLRTADSVTPSLTGIHVLLSLLFYAVAYLVIYPTGFFYILRIIRKGPDEAVVPAPVQAGRPQMPVQELPRTELIGGRR